MRLRILILLLFQLSLTKAFGQIELELYFKNNCNDSIYKLSYVMLDLSNYAQPIKSVENKILLPKRGSYYLFTYLVKGDFVHNVEQGIIINNSSNLVDTLLIPKLYFTTTSQSQDNFWGYINCDKLCNGLVTDYYENGNKRLTGDFVDGKPNWIAEYRMDGTKIKESWYTVGNKYPIKLCQYNDNGQLTTYEIKKFKKRKTITSTYNSFDKLIKRQIDNIE